MPLVVEETDERAVGLQEEDRLVDRPLEDPRDVRSVDPSWVSCAGAWVRPAAAGGTAGAATGSLVRVIVA